jgi:vanillate O-demethylase ferredoxin subunit
MKSSQNWNEAHVQSIRDLTPSVREFTIRPSAGALPWSPGSHLQVEVLVAAKPQLRMYSLIGRHDDPLGAETYRIAVKRLDEGRGGSLAMWRLEAGDRLRVSDPQNHFPLAFGAPAYLLVAGGIGITPLVSMAQALAARGASVRMLYGARAEAELAYAGDLRNGLGAALHTAVGAPIDFDAEIAALPAGAQMYVCGPVPMLDAARHAWQAAGRPLADLRYETFGNSGRFAPAAFRVRIPRHQLDITVPADCSLLEALEGAGVQTLFDCRRGECGLCAMDVLAVDGAIDHRDVFLSEHEKEGNTRICACVSRVVGGITLDSAYRSDAC